MKRNLKTIRNYIIYSLIVAILFGLLSPIITRYINNNEFFDWQWFVWALLSAIFILLLYLFFPKFKRSGEL